MDFKKNYIIDGFKICSACGLNKEVTEYSRSSKNPEVSGLFTSAVKSTCKSCDKIKKKEYYEALKLKNPKPVIDESLITEKECTACKVVKNLSEFYSSKAGWLKTKSRCKVCMYAEKLAYEREQSVEKKEAKKAALEIKLATATHKICYICKTEKPLDSFYKDSYQVDGKSTECKTCCSSRQRDATHKKIIDKTKEDSRTFIVYFVDDGTNSLVKIGRVELNDTNKDTVLINRLRNIQTGSPNKIKLLGSTKAGNYSTEYRIHQKFKELNHHKEWFNSSPELLDFISKAITITNLEELHKYIDNYQFQPEPIYATPLHTQEFSI